MSIRLRISGEFACFTRPEMKVERVSYDVITPSAAVGIFEAIYWKPSIRWHIKEIQVLKPVKFQSIRTNEVKVIGSMSKASAARSSGFVDGLAIDVGKERTQRTSQVLIDVDYIVEGYFSETGTEPSNASKHASIFNRRAASGQCFQQPALGLRQFPARFELLNDDSTVPSPIAECRDLGFMLHHIDHDSTPKRPAFFRASMRNGVISVPNFDSPEVVK